MKIQTTIDELLYTDAQEAEDEESFPVLRFHGKDASVVVTIEVGPEQYEIIKPAIDQIGAWLAAKEDPATEEAA